MYNGLQYILQARPRNYRLIQPMPHNSLQWQKHKVINGNKEEVVMI